MSDHTIKVSTKGSIATICIDRPEARNALRAIDKLALAHAVTDAAHDGIRAIVLRGAGERAFCAGTDIKEMGDFDIPQATKMFQAEAAMFDAIIRVGVPVIAAVHGYALGGGCVLSYCCDLTIADTTAVFGQPEVRNGVPAPVQAALLPHIVGLGLPRRMIFLGETLTADQALAAGLVTEVTSPDRLYERAEEIAQVIEAYPARGIALQKEIVSGWFRYPFDTAVETSVHVAASAFASDEPNAAISGFLKTR